MSAAHPTQTSALRTWRVRAVDAGPHNGAVRWVLDATCGTATARVVADVARSGRVFDVQSDDTATDGALVEAITGHVAAVLALRRVWRGLDAADDPRRELRPSDREWVV